MSTDTPNPEEFYRQGTLVSCLETLSQIYDNPKSAEVLCGGLPLEEPGALTADLFDRAAERAKLLTQSQELPLQAIKNSMAPMVLLFDKTQGCLLLSVDGITADIQVGDVRRRVPVQELAEHYSGHSILVKPDISVKNEVDRPADAKEQKAAKSTWFWSEFKPAWPIYGEVIFASVFVNLLALASPLFVRTVYDRVIPDPNQTLITMWTFAIGVFVAFVLDFFLRMLRTFFLDVTAKNVDTRLSAKIFEHLVGLRMDNKMRSLGGLTGTIQGFEAFRNFIASVSITVLVDVPFIALFILVIWWIGGSLFWIPLILIPLVLTVSLLIQIPLARLLQQSFDAGMRKQSYLIEALIGLHMIKARNAHSQMQHKWEQTTGFLAKIGVKTRFYSSLAVNFSVFAQYLGNVLVIIVGVYQISEGNLTMGSLIACTILCGRALAPIVQLASLIMTYYQARVGLDRVSEVMELPTERPAEKSFLHRPKLTGHIGLQKAYFSYPQAPLPALDAVSFDIKPGESVGIIGRVGSGKSTLLKLIMGYYRLNKGSLLVDNTDVNQIDPAELRRNIGYVPQDVMLFQGSIRDNIALGALSISDEKVLDAAQKAGLDQMIAHHPDGLAMMVGDRGELLSGGQRQAIAIAQALLYDPPILLFDEPTSAMDDLAENRFKALIKEQQKKTLLLVTHKGSMLSLVDRLILLDGGKIAADGPRDKILSKLKAGKIKVQKD